MKWSSLGLRAPKQTLDILGLPHIYSRFRHHARWASLGAAMATSSSRISQFLRSLLLFGFIHFYFHQALERWWRDEYGCVDSHLPCADYFSELLQTIGPIRSLIATATGGCFAY